MSTFRWQVHSLLVVVAISCCMGSLNAASIDDFKWRIYCDTEAGVSFRFPYRMRPMHQYKPEVSMIWIDAKTGLSSYSRRPPLYLNSVELDAGPWVAFTDFADVARMSAAVDPGLSDSQLLEQFAERQEFADSYTVTPFDYYSMIEQRPHADEDWAPKGIEALWLESEVSKALAVKYDNTIHTLVVWNMDELTADQEAILQSFEILPHSGEDAHTWRQAQCAARRPAIFAGNGSAVRLSVAARAPGPATWADAWEVETAHYHLTSELAPEVTYRYAAFLEALYQEFLNAYEPETIPPYKLEMHLFASQERMAVGAAAMGVHGVDNFWGFFVPSHFAICAYDNKRGPMEEVLAHECSHQFLHAACNGSDHVPTWVNEGLAVYFENVTYKNGRIQLDKPRERISFLKQQYSRSGETLWPMEQYIDWRGHIDPANYAEVYAMVHFWIFGNGKQGLERFREYWTALKRGEDGAKAFEAIFLKRMIEAQGGREQAFQAWEQHMLRYVKAKL